MSFPIFCLAPSLITPSYSFGPVMTGPYTLHHTLASTKAHTDPAL